MNEIVRRLIDANKRYMSSGEFSGDVSAARRAENASGQMPYAVVVTCSDSRGIPEAVFSAGLEDLTVIGAVYDIVSGEVRFIGRE